MLVADVILPLPLPQVFSYRIPSAFSDEVTPGKRVVVPFGKQKVYAGLIRNVREDHPIPTSLKEIQGVLDDLPVVNSKQFELWDWIAEYYMCSLGEVMSCALPAALKLQSETFVLAADVDPTKIEMTAAEQDLFELLSGKKSKTIDELASELRRGNIHPLIKRSFEKGLIHLSEEIQERYKPKTEVYLRLAAAYQSESGLQQLFEELESDPRRSRQVEALMTFLKYLYDRPERDKVNKSVLLKHNDISKSAIQTLIKQGNLIEVEEKVDRIPLFTGKVEQPMELTGIQQKVVCELHEKMQTHDVSLLHGVTSSGKTEVYIHLIENAIRSGKQVLYLLPEIALTTQIIQRLQKHFGDRVGVYHSRYSDNERVDIWNQVLNFNYSEAHFYCRSQIVLGARSALFLPFKDLGLIIVDEEHDTGYKQDDPAPRYHGRDSAIVLARIHKSKTVLGSATPSLETYFNAENDRYGLVKLTERHGGMEMPEIIIADMKVARMKKQMKSIFTPQLIHAVEKALENKEQIILFQNRRGFSPFLECKNCSWIPHCKNCSVTLTYHKYNNTLRCHYCGYVEATPSVCPTCFDHHLEVKGFGTEKVEEEISVFFPDAAIARMDLDSTRSKSSYQRIIQDFEDHRIDILVGTQMITKGLDFGNVSTVGILNADQLLNFPDFRSHERGFQLMAQVSGRSGRKQKRGKVIIQTFQPEHSILQDVVHHNYMSFYSGEMKERKQFHYPPFSRLIELTVRHKDEMKAHESATLLTEWLRLKLGQRVLGPNVPLVARIRNLYYRNIMIKIDRSESTTDARKVIKGCLQQFYSDRSNQSVRVIIDVDPF